MGSKFRVQGSKFKLRCFVFLSSTFHPPYHLLTCPSIELSTNPPQYRPAHLASATMYRCNRVAASARSR